MRMIKEVQAQPREEIWVLRGSSYFRGYMMLALENADPGQAGRAYPFEIFVWFVFVKFDCIEVKTQCVQYVFYSLIWLQEHRVCVKGPHQTIPRPQEFYLAMTAPPPGFEIPGSATVALPSILLFPSISAVPPYIYLSVYNLFKTTLTKQHTCM